MQPKEVLIQERENKMLTQQGMADKLGISLRNYQRYEEGLFPKHKTDIVIRIDDILGTNIYALVYDNKGRNQSFHQELLEHKNGKQKKVPVMGGFTTLGNIEVYNDEGMKNEVVANLPGNIFPGCNYAERAMGDSMYPLIMNQALLVGKTCTVKGITYGEKYIIKTKDGLDTVKFVHPSDKDGRIKLKAYNKSIPDQDVTISDIVFCCRVQWIINPT